MHILIVHNFYRSEHPSGEDMVVQQEAALLRGAGHEVEMYSRQSDDIADFSTSQKVALPARVIWSVEDQIAMSERLNGSHFDVMHIHNSFPLISPSILSAARKYSVPVVMTLHNYRLVCAAGTFLRNGSPCTKCLGALPVPALTHRCYRGQVSATLPLALSIAIHSGMGTWARGIKKFIVMSDFAKNIMTSAGIPPDQLTIKPHFIPRPKGIRAGSGNYALYLGRLSIEKGASVLIKSWRPEFGKLLIVGDGPLRADLEAQALAQGNSIEFLGNLARKDAMNIISKAEFLVNPSRAFETFGLSVVEAFAHAVPAIVPNQGVFPELVRNNINGLIFESGNSESLANAIAEISRPGAAARMGAAARNDYEALFTPEQNLSLLENIYLEAMRPSI